MPQTDVLNIGRLDRIQSADVVQMVGWGRIWETPGVFGAAIRRDRRWRGRRTGPPAVIATVTVLLGLLCWSEAAHAHNAPQSHRARQRTCSSYPTPGSLAPADAQLPAWLTARYAMLKTPQRRIDRLTARQVHLSLTASGLVLGHSRFLGRAAFGGRVYLVPAEHLLSFTLAPARCLPVAERSLETELAPQLRRQYRHWALCIVILHPNSGSPTCGAAGADPEALLYAAGTPGFGLVLNGIADVTIHYLTAPDRTVRVHDNFYLVDDPSQSVAPCSLEWEDVSGNVSRTFAGCDYTQLLTAPLEVYRAYVATTLSTLGTQVSALIAAINAGDLLAARSAWLTAHESWLDVGQDDGAYSAYGPLGSALDATAEGDALGTADPGFTGFHRVELDLFTDDDLGAAASDAAQLATILGQVTAIPTARAFPDTANGLANWLLRPHEVLEDAIRDTLSGDDEYGSGTGIASVSADVTATREFLTVLAPALDPLAPRLLARAGADLTALQSACVATQVDGRWVGVADLTARQRELIDADAGAAAELLARVPDTLSNVGNGAPGA